MTRHNPVAAILLSVLLPSDGTAATIICKDIRVDTESWVSKRLDEADVVLLGRVISAETQRIRPRKPIGDGSATSMSELLEMIEEAQSQPTDYTTHHWQSVSFEVLKIWKGPSFRVFSVKNNVVPGQYGAPLQVTGTYLVFGYRREGQIYTISTVCGDTKTEADAADRIRTLDDLAEINKPPNKSLH